MKKMLAVLGLASLAACSGVLSTSGRGSACTTNSQCNAGLQCVANACAEANFGSADGGDGGSSGTHASTGGSSGGSTGSTGSLPATGANFALINGAPHYSGAGLDVCVRAQADAAFTSALLGGAGVTYGNGSNFVAVGKVAATVRVIPAGGDCATAALFTPDVDFDFSTDGYYTGVVTGDTNGVAGLTIVQGNAPSDAQTVNYAFVHALVGEGTISSVLNPLPYGMLNSATLAIAGSATGNLSPLTGQALKVVGTNGTHYFKNYTPVTGGTVATLAIIGDVAQSGDLGPALVVCLDGQGTDGLTASCAKVEKNANALAYVRAANLVDTSDAVGHGSGMTICALPSTASALGAPATWTLVGAEVGNFVPVDVGGDTKVYFAASDCGTTLPTAANTVVTLTAAADQYYSVAAGGSSAVGYAARSYTTQPAAAADQAIVTTENFAAEAAHFFATTNFSFPSLFGLSIGSSIAFATNPSPITLSADQLSHLAGSTLVANETLGADLESDFAFALPAGTASTISVWLGGTGATTYALVCADDGSSAGSLSVCAAAPNTASLTFGTEGLARLANLSSGSLALCVSPDNATWTKAETVIAGSVGTYIGVASGTEYFGAVGAASSGPCTTTKPTTLVLGASVAEVAGSYLTLVATDAGFNAGAVGTPTSNSGKVDFELINEATDTPHITYIGGTQLTNAAVGDSIAFGLTNLSTTLTVGTTTFTVAAVDLGAYTAITSGAGASHALLWCDDYAGTCVSVPAN